MTNMSLLQIYFSGIGSIFASNNIKSEFNMTKLFFLFRINFKLFSKRVLENLLHLWITSGVKLNKNLNTNKKKYKTELLT